MKEKKVTTNDLARMIQENVVSKMAMKDNVNERFDKVDKRFDRIENILLRDHLNRIERLEDSVRVLKTKAGIR